MVNSLIFGLPSPSLPAANLPSSTLPVAKLPATQLPTPKVQSWNLGVQTSESKKATPLKETEI
jgi:hypothetical protein